MSKPLNPGTPHHSGHIASTRRARRSANAAASVAFVLLFPVAALAVTFSDSMFSINGSGAQAHLVQWTLTQFLKPSTPGAAPQSLPSICDWFGQVAYPPVASPGTSYVSLQPWVQDLQGTATPQPNGAAGYQGIATCAEIYNATFTGSVIATIDWSILENQWQSTYGVCGQAFGPAIKQTIGGTVTYYVVTGLGTSPPLESPPDDYWYCWDPPYYTNTGSNNGWTPFSKTALTAASFVNINPDGSFGTQSPTFTNPSAVTACGFFVNNVDPIRRPPFTNNNGPYGYTDSSYTNWTCTINTPTPSPRPTPPTGLLKVCKVAGPGVTLNTTFSFTVGQTSGMFFTPPPPTTISVNAGPPPGGTCSFAYPFPLGQRQTVTETNIPHGLAVSSITAAPRGNVVSTNVAGASAIVTVGSGVTDITFTDSDTGYLEICKRGQMQGPASFSVQQASGPTPWVLFNVSDVWSGTCSPAIPVTAGTFLITETAAGSYYMAGCHAIPSSAQVGPCNYNSAAMTVTVVPGDVSTQTIAIFTNARPTPPPRR